MYALRILIIINIVIKRFKIIAGKIFFYEHNNIKAISFIASELPANDVNPPTVIGRNTATTSRPRLTLAYAPPAS